jgi:uncharacterized protein (DUF2237 family)
MMASLGVWVTIAWAAWFAKEAEMTDETGKGDAVNVLGTALKPCCMAPKTGWFRDGYCRTDEQDRGLHVVCAEVDARFLAFSKARGNDLTTPRPEYAFPGLKPGDHWCLCARRWLEAHEAGAAPPVVLEATHAKAATVIPLDVLIGAGRPN